VANGVPFTHLYHVSKGPRGFYLSTFSKTTTKCLECLVTKTQAEHPMAREAEHVTTTIAIYARVSAEDQGKGFSIPTQIEASQKLGECTASRRSPKLTFSLRRDLYGC
jgi:hypothetical protein